MFRRLEPTPDNNDAGRGSLSNLCAPRAGACYEDESLVRSSARARLHYSVVGASHPSGLSLPTRVSVMYGNERR